MEEYYKKSRSISERVRVPLWSSWHGMPHVHHWHRLQISCFPFCSAASKNEIAEPTHRYEKVPLYHSVCQMRFYARFGNPHFHTSWYKFSYDTHGGVKKVSCVTQGRSFSGYVSTNVFTTRPFSVPTVREMFSRWDPSRPRHANFFRTVL